MDEDGDEDSPLLSMEEDFAVETERPRPAVVVASEYEDDYDPATTTSRDKVERPTTTSVVTNEYDYDYEGSAMMPMTTEDVDIPTTMARGMMMMDYEEEDVTTEGLLSTTMRKRPDEMMCCPCNQNELFRVDMTPTMTMLTCKPPVSAIAWV